MVIYNSIISIVNTNIGNFSNFFKPEHAIPLIDETKLIDPKYCWNLKEVGWNETMFPGDESPGVYLIFGRKRDNKNILGVYIGKASYKSLIGNRLYSHLKHGKDDKNYSMKDKTGNEFYLDFVATIPMKANCFFATSLEEYLIQTLQDEEINLLNVVGKY